MERCPNCGNKLSNIDVLCPRCGTVVEVIQIKSSIATEAAANTVAADSKVKKKEFPQSFIVYNEDFPTGAESKESRGTESESVSSDLPVAVEAPADNADQAAGQSILSRYRQQLEDNGEEAVAPAGKAADDGKEYDNDYSSRYLENIMNMNLPEIDDLQNFDPDEFMREYKRSKKNSAPSEEAAEPKKRWLEIEEADASALNTPAVKQSETPSEPAEPVTQRRYRSTAVRESHEEQPVRQIKEQQPVRQVEEQPARQIKPVSQMKKKKANILASVLLWVLVTAAFFFCFIFFDKYVQRAYGTYDNLIYSITNGKVDLNPGD